MNKVLLLTPFYYADDIHIEATAVVNYYARAWKKIGIDVRVIHLPSLFPYWMRKVAKPFLRQLEARLNATINCESVKERQYEDEGVKVYRIPMVKVKPHSRYSKRVINTTYNRIIAYLNISEFKPDVIIAHWVNPGAELISLLKDCFKVPACMVLHSDGREFQSLYGEDSIFFRKNIDIFGFRSKALKEGYEGLYGLPSKWFYCYSGIPDECIIDSDVKKEFSNRFIYVGNLRERKHPESVVKAIARIYSPADDFELKYIGTGALESRIKQITQESHFNDRQVKLMGYMSREDVLENLRMSDVFVMISSQEVFGLVYLEAMAMGCIPIGSIGEGIDGVIVDGVNGFLVPSGDDEALSKVISRIGKMSDEERHTIVQAAFNTAKHMTDTEVAKSYINHVLSICI